MPDEIVIPAPSDFHLHLRDGAVMRAVAPASRWAGRVLVMPNVDPPVTGPENALDYRVRARAAIGDRVEVLSTIKLTTDTTPDVIRRSAGTGVVAAKLYPAGVTTNSHDGIPADWLVNPVPQRFADVLGAMQDVGMVLCCHGEMPGRETFSPNGWEKGKSGAFLLWLIRAVLHQFGTLRAVIEHISTAGEADWVANNWNNCPDRVAATVTPHHLIRTLDDVIGDKLRPHEFCKPVAKTDFDRSVIAKFSTSGHPAFFLGTDSAPHPVGAKECAECCAGVFNAHAALGTVADVFDRAGALDNLAAFTSGNGDAFYRRATTPRRIKLERKPNRVPDQLWVSPGTIGREPIRNWRAGETLPWSWEEVA